MSPPSADVDDGVIEVVALAFDDVVVEATEVAVTTVLSFLQPATTISAPKSSRPMSDLSTTGSPS